MKELIAGRITKDDRPISELMIELFFDGLAGKVVLSEVESINRKGFTTVHRQFVSPAVFLKALHDYMLKSRELALKTEDAKKKEKGTGGGIRIVLPSVPADPLLKPGQKPRPLRLLGQDPSKPLPDATGTATDAQPSPGPAKRPVDTSGHHVAVSAAEQQPSPAPAPNSDDTFDPAELVEDFEHPICQICMGTGWVRDENGIHMVTCDYCEGEGRAPDPE